MSIYSTIKVPCSTCKETGKVPDPNDPKKQIKCSRCQGTGKIPRRARPRVT